MSTSEDREVSPTQVPTTNQASAPSSAPSISLQLQPPNQTQIPSQNEDQEQEEQKFDKISTLILEKAKLEDRALKLEHRIEELETQRQEDVRVMIWLRVEMARAGLWWTWVQRLGWQGSEGTR